MLYDYLGIQKKDKGFGAPLSLSLFNQDNFPQDLYYTV